LEEIRAELDRIAVKRKEEIKGFLVQVHPCKGRKNVRYYRLGR